MKAIRAALSSRPQLILVLAILIGAIGVTVSTAQAAGGSNMVSVFRTDGADCYADLVPPTGSWNPLDGDNDAKDEVAAGKAATGNGKFAGVRPIEVALKQGIPECGRWTPTGV